jgi:hypothetical protein
MRERHAHAGVRRRRIRTVGAKERGRVNLERVCAGRGSLGYWSLGGWGARRMRRWMRSGSSWL